MFITAQIPEINNLNLLSHNLKYDELLTYTLNNYVACGQDLNNLCLYIYWFQTVKVSINWVFSWQFSQNLVSAISPLGRIYFSCIGRNEVVTVVFTMMQRNLPTLVKLSLLCDS